MGSAIVSDDTPIVANGASTVPQRSASFNRRQDEREEKEMFSKLEKPRVRYDVEVVTKLIVYAGESNLSARRDRLANIHLRDRLDSG